MFIQQKIVFEKGILTIQIRLQGHLLLPPCGNLLREPHLISPDSLFNRIFGWEITSSGEQLRRLTLIRRFRIGALSLNFPGIGSCPDHLTEYLGLLIYWKYQTRRLDHLQQFLSRLRICIGMVLVQDELFYW